MSGRYIVAAAVRAETESERIAARNEAAREVYRELVKYIEASGKPLKGRCLNDSHLRAPER